MVARGIPVDGSFSKARVVPLLFACVLAAPASFAGYVTLGFCGIRWGCLRQELLILAAPAACLSIWFDQLGAKLLWIVLAVALLQALPIQSGSTATIVILVLLFAAALLTQLATPIGRYLVGDTGEFDL